VAELLRVACVAPDYLSLDEEERVALLRAELTTLRPLASNYVDYGAEVASELAIVRAAAEAHRRFGPQSITTYIISKAATVSDLLEVMVMLKEAGLYRPGAGRILYNDVPSDRIDLDKFRERIGFVTQDAQLFSGTIRENLLFVRPDATDEQCLAVMRRAAATSLLNRADKGLDTVIGEGGMKISGGEKQRLSIARALLREPHLLVFDEATSSLDSLTEEEISRTMRDVAESADVITVLIAHRLSTVLHADTIYVLERGRIVEQGHHDELLERKGLYYAMWRQQVGERREIAEAGRQLAGV